MTATVWVLLMLTNYQPSGEQFGREHRIHEVDALSTYEKHTDCAARLFELRRVFASKKWKIRFKCAAVSLDGIPVYKDQR